MTTSSLLRPAFSSGTFPSFAPASIELSTTGTTSASSEQKDAETSRSSTQTTLLEITGPYVDPLATLETNAQNHIQILIRANDAQSSRSMNANAWLLIQPCLKTPEIKHQMILDKVISVVNKVLSDNGVSKGSTADKNAHTLIAHVQALLYDDLIANGKEERGPCSWCSIC